MFGRFFRKEKPRVFLGVLAVAPRTDLKRHIDEWGVFDHLDLDSGLRQSLTEIFALAPIESVEKPLATDLVLDVVVPKFESGDAWGVDLVDLGFPIFWRPKITVTSRLYSLTTQKTKATFSVTEKMTWRRYLCQITTLRALIRFRPVFDQNDMERLLYQASVKLLAKMQKAI